MSRDQEVKDMDTLDTPWCWYYLADCGRWHRFEEDPDNPLSSHDIERYYLRDTKGVLSMSSSNFHSKIDFSEMFQTDLNTGRNRRVRRGCNNDRRTMSRDQEVKDMDTLDTPWCWYYLADCGQWHRFEEDPDNPLSSHDIERYYLRDTKGVLSMSSSNFRSKIDFSEMFQTDLNTGRNRRVRRGCNNDRRTMSRDQEVKDMDTLDTPWCWYYLADCGQWHRFEEDPDNPLSSHDIERYYLRDSKGVLSMSSSNFRSKIDFSEMLQTDLNMGRKRRVRRGCNIDRSCSCFTAAPVFWENIDPTCPYQLIPLSELTPEYKCVASYVKEDGLLDKSIISISRIQNLDLWDIFCRKKKQLMRIQGVKHIEEKRLFHGTDVQNVDNICKYNFDLRLAGQRGHVWGKGIYFAKHAAYADRYSSSSPEPLSLYGGQTRGGYGEKTRIIFLARVMVGKSKVGDKHFQKPDHGCLENTHDSCVDDIKHPNLFVIFDPNQIYPEYLIQYK